MAKTVPTMEIVGDAGRVVINAADWPMWEKRGYKPVDEDADVTEDVVEDEPDDEEEDED